MHTCCAPCASACIPRLKSLGHEVVLFYCNSNIATQEEFDKRFAEVQRLAAADGVMVVKMPYNHADWLEKVAKGFENEPERGARCERCFRYNLAKCADWAREHGFALWTTSLTVSPHKPSKLIFACSDDPAFLREDFKKRDGFKLSLVRSKELELYRQSYCGCEFSKRPIP